MIAGKPDDYTYSFPAIRGIQAGREYYTAMIPLKLVPILFRFDGEDIPEELRAQRRLNKARVPKIAQYLLENSDSYVFSSLTASVNGEVHFEPNGPDGIQAKVGVLTVPMEAGLVINDGQHRRAAIVQAIDEAPELGNESISVVLFVDAGLKRSQQMFADLNRYSVRTTRSLGILYDHRDPAAKLVNDVVQEVAIFRDMTEKARSTISNRSRKLFTLSGIYNATTRLLRKKSGAKISARERQLAIDFWNAVAKHMRDWQSAADRAVNPGELRRDYVHAHGVALQALAIAGSALIENYPTRWKTELKKIEKIDWARRNAKLWEGRALIGGRVSKSHNNIVLTANVLKKLFDLPLDPTEKKVESLFDQANRQPSKTRRNAHR